MPFKNQESNIARSLAYPVYCPTDCLIQLLLPSNAVTYHSSPTNRYHQRKPLPTYNSGNSEARGRPKLHPYSTVIPVPHRNHKRSSETSHSAPMYLCAPIADLYGLSPLQNHQCSVQSLLTVSSSIHELSFQSRKTSTPADW